MAEKKTGWERATYQMAERVRAMIVDGLDNYCLGRAGCKEVGAREFVTGLMHRLPLELARVNGKPAHPIQLGGMYGFHGVAATVIFKD